MTLNRPTCQSGLFIRTERADFLNGTVGTSLHGNTRVCCVGQSVSYNSDYNHVQSKDHINRLCWKVKELYPAFAQDIVKIEVNEAYDIDDPWNLKGQAAASIAPYCKAAEGVWEEGKHNDTTWWNWRGADDGVAGGWDGGAACAADASAHGDPGAGRSGLNPRPPPGLPGPELDARLQQGMEAAAELQTSVAVQELQTAVKELQTRVAELETCVKELTSNPVQKEASATFQ